MELKSDGRGLASAPLFPIRGVSETVFSPLKHEVNGSLKKIRFE